MEPLFPNGVAAVTGGVQGIGLAVATALAREKCKIAIIDINEERIAEAVTAIRKEGVVCEGYRTDVGDIADCRRVAARIESEIGPVSVLVNSAGATYRGTIDSPDFDEAFERLMRINLQGTLNLVRACWDQLKATKGAVVNIASAAGLVAGTGNIPYSASKGAVVQLTRTLARDLGPFGVRVNAVAPYTTETPMTQDLFKDAARMDVTRNRTFLKRLAKPDDIAGPILFLASPLAKYITGITLPVDGGFTAS